MCLSSEVNEEREKQETKRDNFEEGIKVVMMMWCNF